MPKKQGFCVEENTYGVYVIHNSGGIKQCYRHTKGQPPKRFVELSHAEWVEDEDMYGDPIYRCSNCNEHFVLEEGTPTDNCYSYCPNCGAKMDEQALKERENNAE